MKTKLMDGERLLAGEMANLFRGWESVGGRLYVTNRRVIFEPHFLNFRRRVTEMPLTEIEEVRPRNTLGLIPNGMEVETCEGVRYQFVVWGRERIIDMIQVCKGGALWEDDEKRPAPNRRAAAAAGRRPGRSGDQTRLVGGRDGVKEGDVSQPRICGTARSRYTPAEEDDAWMRTASRAWCWCTTG